MLSILKFENYNSRTLTSRECCSHNAKDSFLAWLTGVGWGGQIFLAEGTGTYYCQFAYKKMYSRYLKPLIKYSYNFCRLGVWINTLELMSLSMLLLRNSEIRLTSPLKVFSFNSSRLLENRNSFSKSLLRIQVFSGSWLIRFCSRCSSTKLVKPIKSWELIWNLWF